jgi:predicted Zn-dependent protease
MKTRNLLLASSLVLAPILALAPLRAGTAAEQLGKVTFPTSCDPKVQAQFERGVAMLHSYWFTEGRKTFESILQQDPGCGIAYWGLAINLLINPLAAPPPAKNLQAGWEALEKARVMGAKTQRERDWIEALSAFYRDYDKVPHRTRQLAYEKAMEQLTQRYPGDSEAWIYYALALNITALPTDQTYSNQLKAAAILERLFKENPDHPGVAHYLIHNYDYPSIADKGLPAARRYAGIAPPVPHAQHMPSHIFTRVGAWQDSADTNRRCAAAAPGANEPDEHAHCNDYTVYAYLQLAKDHEARRVYEESTTVGGFNPGRPTAFYALAAGPARIALERGDWREAAQLQPRASPYPFTVAITHFARALGAARSGDLAAADKDAGQLALLHQALLAAKNNYWANEVEVQRLAVAAWIAVAKGEANEALRFMNAAADLEDKNAKSPVTPGRVLPARELLGEMLLELNQPALALKEFEASQMREPNRFRGFYGAARSADAAGDRQKAADYYAKLVALTKNADTARPELARARAYPAQR